MDKRWVLTGRIVGGVKRAAYFTQLVWVQEQCMEKLGFRPYPGTLNLEILEEGLSILEELRKEEGEKLIPSDPNFCTARVLPVSLGSEKGAIIIPAEDVQVHGKKIVEIIAPRRLKDVLNVNDGSLLTIVIKASSS
jgi:CTP-dependent riboflavin kinase